MMPNDRTIASQWYVYLLRCSDGALYTGITTNVSRRLAEHREAKGKGAKYLRGKGPLHLVFKKAIGSKGLALSVEGCIKKLSKARKEALIEHNDVVERIIARVIKTSVSYGDSREYRQNSRTLPPPEQRGARAEDESLMMSPHWQRETEDG